METKHICSICNHHIEEDYHTAQPVAKGYCCSNCYNEVVKPRVKFFFSVLEKGAIEDEEQSSNYIKKIKYAKRDE